MTPENPEANDFYLLEQDLRIPDIAVIESVPNNIDPLSWMSGVKRAPPGLLRLKLRGGDERTDIIGSLLTLFSDDLRDALLHFGVTNVDYFPVELEHPRNTEIESGYSLVNIIGRKKCVDMTRTTITPRPSGARGELKSFYIDPMRTDDLPIFRLYEEATHIIITKPLREYLQSLPLGGVRMRHTRVYDGF